MANDGSIQGHIEGQSHQNRGGPYGKGNTRGGGSHRGGRGGRAGNNGQKLYAAKPAGEAPAGKSWYF